MNSHRIHGEPPYRVAVLHGGPGAPGEMAPVARELSVRFGVIEPLQSKTSVTGQVEELREILEEIGSLPMVLIGWSFGAWIGYIFSAMHPSRVSKLILVGSGPFREEYASNIMRTRMGRLNDQERSEVLSLNEAIGDPDEKDKDHLLMRFAEIISRADSFDPVDQESDLIEGQYDVYKGVWGEASEMRRNGSLLDLGRRIKCPVVALHGDYDPHPCEGVRDPLSEVLHNFRFTLLEKCGHKPWVERSARDEFFRILSDEIDPNSE